MITSIFKKSKPINYVIISCFIIITYTLFNYQIIFKDLVSTLIFILNLAILISYVFILDFIILKNSLSHRNSYIIMIFAILLSFFPQVIAHTNILYSNLFILLALRRLLGLKFNNNINKKLFDIGLWIAIASLFYFWSILFFSLVIIALIYHNTINIRTIIIPLLGIATTLILFVAYNIVTTNQYLLSTNFNTQISVNYANYNNVSVIKLTILLLVFIWVSTYYFKTLKPKNKNLKPTYFLIICSIFIAITIALLAPNKTGSEFLFLYAPFSILTGIYIESVKENGFRNLFVILILMGAILVEILS